MTDTNRIHWIENDSRFIAAHQQPATLISLALSRQIEINRLLRGTGIFHRDILQQKLMISPLQYRKLIENAWQLIPRRDTSFLLGHQLFPGSYGQASELLQQACSLQQALEVIKLCQLQFSPLMALNTRLDDNLLHIHFIDTCGLGQQRSFVLETLMTGLSQLGRWHNLPRLPWAFHFSYKAPDYREQYDVHLGGEIHFNAQVDAMTLPVKHLHETWLDAQKADFSELLPDPNGIEASDSQWLEAVYLFLQENIRQCPSMERCAEHFYMSPATFKRKLTKHQTSFQKLQDSIRKAEAVYLFDHKGWTNEQVADYLNIGDINNFRRAFKRWTGMTPSLFKGG